MKSRGAKIRGKQKTDIYIYIIENKRWWIGIIQFQSHLQNLWDVLSRTDSGDSTSLYPMRHPFQAIHSRQVSTIVGNLAGQAMLANPCVHHYSQKFHFKIWIRHFSEHLIYKLTWSLLTSLLPIGTHTSEISLKQLQEFSDASALWHPTVEEIFQEKKKKVNIINISKRILI